VCYVTLTRFLHFNARHVMRYPHRLLIAVPLVAALSACSSLPFGGKSGDERKAECDRIAARAIQTSSLDEAKTLSAQASECYAKAKS
jgi:hypothetical protein